MQLASTPMTKRLATAVAAVLVLFVTAMPAAAVCCLGKPGSGTMASMHASMPCCAEHCRMSTPNRGRDHDATLTPAPAPQAAATAAALVTVGSTPAPRAIPTASTSADLSPPPPFLVNSQFRI